jgi:PAS domain-containing protein
VEDEIQGVVLTFTDITARKQAEEARRKSEARLNAFVKATSDLIYRMSPDWSEVYHMEGRPLVDPDDPERTWLEAIVPDEERDRVAAAIRDARDTERPLHLEHRVVQPDGSQGWMASRAVPIRDEDGTLVEWFGTSTDITDRKAPE